MNKTTTIHRFIEDQSEHLLAYISQQRETQVQSLPKRCRSCIPSLLPPIITL